MGAPAILRLKVRHYEVDEYGHVNHANYVHYLEAGRIEALESVGLPLAETRRQGYLIVAVDLSIRYHAPARSGETLEIATHIRELRGARSIWVQEIREATSRRLVVTAEVTGAFMTEGGRPVRVPEAFNEKLAALWVTERQPSGPGDRDARSGARGRRLGASSSVEPIPAVPARARRAWCPCGEGRTLGQTLRQIGGFGRRRA